LQLALMSRGLGMRRKREGAASQPRVGGWQNCQGFRIYKTPAGAATQRGAFAI